MKFLSCLLIVSVYSTSALATDLVILNRDETVSGIWSEEGAESIWIYQAESIELEAIKKGLLQVSGWKKELSHLGSTGGGRPPVSYIKLKASFVPKENSKPFIVRDLENNNEYIDKTIFPRYRIEAMKRTRDLAKFFCNGGTDYGIDWDFYTWWETEDDISIKTTGTFECR